MLLRHAKAVPAGQLHDRRHVAGDPSEMDRHDGFRLRRDDGFDAVGRHAQRVVVAVDEYRVRSEIAHHLGGGRERIGRDDHLVAGPYTCGFQREMEAGRR